MISIFFAALGIFLIARLFRKNKAAFTAGFFILFSLSYRIVDILYVDLAGPLYAIELEHYVGGNSATPMFVVACAAFILPLWYMYRPDYMRRKLGGPIPDLPFYANLSNLAFVCCTAFLVLMYGNMLRVGTIPLLAGMDRLDYQNIAGPLHNQFYEVSFLFTTTLAIFTVLRRLQGGRYDIRFVMLFLTLLFYWVLTGNRFSIFYRELSFYAAPFAAVLVMQNSGKLKRIGRRDAWSMLVSSRVVVPLASVLATGAAIGLMINSYYNVRDYSDPVFQMTQRALVQPVQLWASTWNDVDFRHSFMPSFSVFDQVFFHPLSTEGNTTIQYLMGKELGYFRAAELISYGQQYAGGYPEILFEIFGPWLAVPAMFLLGMATAFLLRLGTVALSRGTLLTALLSVYVYYGFTLTYIGGFLSFFIAISYIAKVFALLMAMVLEARFVARLKQRHSQHRPERQARPDRRFA